MALKYINIFKVKAFRIYPKWDFWFENIPSGNPGFNIQTWQSLKNDDILTVGNSDVGVASRLRIFSPTFCEENGVNLFVDCCSASIKMGNFPHPPFLVGESEAES
jgi:hypothetical protein